MQMILEAHTQAAEAPVTATMNRMTRMLKIVGPASDAEALKMLRGAFPQTSLSERIAALARHASGKLAHIS